MKLIIANLKMNKTNTETSEYIEELDKKLEETTSRVCLCLPFTALCLAKKYKGGKFVFGAQNMHEEECGQYTGEISARMLKDLGVKLVLLGHSERRKYFNETNERINKKIKTALRYGFEIVLCVGETRAQKNTGRTRDVLRSQIESALVGIYENELKSVIIAYEPVWAVGTGKVADDKYVTTASNEIRKIITEHYSPIAGEEIKIIYGGSLTSQNSKNILSNKSICGALVGGASLDTDEFVKMIK